GDPIEVDDLLAEVETDKATMEFRSFDKGTLLRLLVPAGAQVKLGQPVAIVGAWGAHVPSRAAQAAAAVPTKPVAAKETPAAAAAPSAEPAAAPPAPSIPPH